ncbi:hypothetical protein QR680_012289 [Steinernema hermaphroditum]|uniref:Ig-like domain-containing protein n=1 Tax=Steinernema hermaphroditum TaxID=289476 RepID=A0AA39I3V2_9BILA|nr:hypothetical protein QR680_012289 [Steinernema hermaphroditum]
MLRIFLALLVGCGQSWSSELPKKLKDQTKRPPMPANGRPLDVHIGAYVESLGKFQPTEMSFDVDLYLYMSWRDFNLNHSNPDYILVNDPKVRQHIWLPDLYFANARTAQFHDVTVPNFNLFIAQDGTIAYSSRVTLNVACNLHLVNYPMDRQVCMIRILSYAYIAKQVNVTWFSTTPIRYNPEIGLPEFTITQIDQSYCNGTYVYAITDTSHKVDSFSCLEGNIHLSRSIGYHLVQSYIPTGLIVTISWVSFWIDRRAVPARVTLSFTTLLSLSTLGNGLRFGLPQVSYAKAIDFWYGACLMFVFCALLEFAIVNSYMRQANKYDKLAHCMEKKPSARNNNHENGKVMVPLSKNSVIYFNNGRMKSTNSEMDAAKKFPLMTNGGSLSVLKLVDGEMEEMRTYANGTVNSYHKASDSVGFYPEKKPSKVKSLYLDSATDNAYSDDESLSNTGTEETDFSTKKYRGSKPFNPVGYQHFIQLGFLYSRKALSIDKQSRVIFPLMFIVFNVTYWTYYLWYIQEGYLQKWFGLDRVSDRHLTDAVEEVEGLKQSPEVSSPGIHNIRRVDGAQSEHVLREVGGGGMEAIGTDRLDDQEPLKGRLERRGSL